MTHVFISYNQEDSDFAGLLMMQLEKAGFETWLDKNRLRPGNDWSQEIDNGIAEAFALVVIMSPDDKSSEYVTYEWSFALGTGIPVFPVLRKKTDLHPRLSRLQYLNFTHDQPWAKLIDELADVQKNSNQNLRLPKETPPYVRHAIATLDNANRGDREAAIDSLAQIELPIANNALISALDHPLRDVKFAAALALGAKGDERAIPVLINALPPDIDFISNEERAYILQKMAAAFLSIGSPSIGPLIEALKARSATMRNLAVGMLGNLKAVEAIPRLATFLESEDWEVQSVINSLMNIGDASAVPILAKAWEMSNTRYFNLIDQVMGAEYLVPIRENFFALYHATAHFRSLDLLPSILKSLGSSPPHIVAYSIISLDYLVKLNGFDADTVVPLLIDLLERQEMIQVDFFVTLDFAPGRAYPIFSQDVMRGMVVRLCDLVAQSLEFIGTPEATNEVKKWRIKQGLETPIAYSPSNYRAG